MIRLMETGEAFTNVYEARESVLRYARDKAKENRIRATLILDAKTYTLREPLAFDADEIPELKNVELSLIGQGGPAVFTSGRMLPLSGIKKDDKIYTYQLEADEKGNYPRFMDFYQGDQRLKLCTSRHFTHAFSFSEENGRDNAENLEGIYIPSEIADLLPDGDLFPMTITLYVEWEFYTVHILSVDRSRIKTDADGKQHTLLKIDPEELRSYVMCMNRSLRPENRECFLSNHEIFLKEGEWCYDHTCGLLRFSPLPDKNEKFFVPFLSKLLVFNGMDGVTLKNLTFTGATDQVTCDNGYISMQANVDRRTWTKAREAAVLTDRTCGLTVANCEFKELGVNGILMCGISARVDIHDNYFHDIAMSAISIGEPVRACLDPKNASYDIQINRNFVSRIAYEFPSSPAIDIFRVDGLLISHNTVEKTAYSAISVGWQWENISLALGEVINIRDAEIAYNKITDFVQVLKDGAAVYVLGANCSVKHSRRFNTMHHNFAKNDRIRDKAMGYYLDGAASHWTVWDNVAAIVQRPLYIQHNEYIPQQHTWHNRAYDIYVTEEVAKANHHPERDVLIGEIYQEDSLDALFEKYPKVRMIFEGAGVQ